MILRLYRLLACLAAPFLRGLMRMRAWRGLEEQNHLSERRGIATLARPSGKLIWLHAASNGEMRSTLPLVTHLLDRNADLTCLITTVTVTAAQLVRRTGHSRILHQYAPFDHPRWAEAFLAHWRPDAVIWVESEFWPVTLQTIHKQRIPLMLVNGRLSERSAKNWSRFKKSIARILGCFEVCLAQSDADAARLKTLGAHHVTVAGNMKYAGHPLLHDAKALESVRTQIGARPVILFASTHAGEEAMATQAHAALAGKHPGLLSIIMPRHPKRGDAIASEIGNEGFNLARRSLNQPITDSTQIYLADTLGEPGLFYRLAPLVFVGNSLITTPGGGHNPIEPAQLGCAIIYGPHMWNFGEIDKALRQARAAIVMRDAAELAPTIDRLLSNPAEMQNLAKAAADFTAAQNGVLTNIITHLHTPLLRAGIES